MQPEEDRFSVMYITAVDLDGAVVTRYQADMKQLRPLKVTAEGENT